MKSIVFSCSLLTSMLFGGEPTDSFGRCLGQSDPTSHADLWSFDAETAAVWRISKNTDINYCVLPQIFSLRSPAFLRTTLFGNDLTLRNRFSLLIEPIAKGPESLYLGFSASPSIEYWFLPNQACFYTSVGGGAGFIDSTNVPGGQGRDLTLNWFATMGVRYYVTPDFAINAGAFFQHLSNGGATDPNPGLDALGPILGVSWGF